MMVGDGLGSGVRLRKKKMGKGGGLVTGGALEWEQRRRIKNKKGKKNGVREKGKRKIKKKKQKINR